MQFPKKNNFYFFSSSQDSPGRFIPLKAYFLLLLDDRYDTVDRFAALTNECQQRMLKRLLHFTGAQKANEDDDNDNENDENVENQRWFEGKLTTREVARRVALGLLKAVIIMILFIKFYLNVFFILKKKTDENAPTDELDEKYNAELPVNLSKNLKSNLNFFLYVDSRTNCFWKCY